MTKEEIDEICEYFSIENYSINKNGLVDINGSVNLSHLEMTSIPLRFGTVSRDFYISYNKLTSLIGAPHTVGQDFYCDNNQLTSLEGSPTKVGGIFNCAMNNLTDLKGSPDEVGGTFTCIDNKIYSLEGFDTKLDNDYGFWYKSTPVSTVLGGVVDRCDSDLIDAIKVYKVIKGKEVNLRRLKYVMSLFDRNVDLDRIKKYYTIV